MIVLDLEQGSPEWLAARLGIPTASCFDKLITATGKASTQADAYANKLIAELLTGEQDGIEQTAYMARGNELEPHAAAFYAVHSDADPATVGFVLRDDRRVGCSPDRLVGADGLLEIKCPAPHTHVGYLLDNCLPSKYRAQVQGQMLLTGRDWCDFLSYHPTMPPLLVRVERDDKFIAALSAEIDALLELMDKRLATLAARGITSIKDAA